MAFINIVPVVFFAHEIFFDSDSDTEESAKEINFCEVVVPQMNSRQFRTHFRMNVETFEDLLSKIHTTYRPHTKGHPEISFEKATMMTIWYLANIESFRGVSERFGISKSTAWHAVYRICKTLLEVNQRFSIIAWPGHNRAVDIEAKFRRQYNFPGIIGVIDGSHIRITAPKENHNSYINRKSYHSVLLQGICDHNRLFTDVYTGEVGSIHDQTLFTRSDASRRPIADFPNDTHLIGDLAYKLTTRMMVGFKQYGNLTDRQKNFNKCLSKTRAVIENSFALLKGRFRRLKMMETIKPHLICLLIVTACILHNICILKGETAEDIMDVNLELAAERFFNPNNDLDIINNDNHNQYNMARIKRNNIVNSLLLIE